MALPVRRLSTVVVVMVVLNVLMALFFLGGAMTFSRHAEMLDDANVTACAVAGLGPDLHVAGLSDQEPDVDFDGRNVLRLSYRDPGGQVVVVRCQYSLPADDDDPPVIEAARVSGR